MVILKSFLPYQLLFTIRITMTVTYAEIFLRMPFSEGDFRAGVKTKGNNCEL